MRGFFYLGIHMQCAGTVTFILLKLQVCTFPVNIAKSFKNSFLHKKPPVTASEKFINFSGKHQWRRSNRFIFLINTTE